MPVHHDHLPEFGVVQRIPVQAHFRQELESFQAELVQVADAVAGEVQLGQPHKALEKGNVGEKVAVEVQRGQVLAPILWEALKSAVADGDFRQVLQLTTELELRNLHVFYSQCFVLFINAFDYHLSGVL